MFKKANYEKNFYFSSGMEFAVEHLIKLYNSSIKITEIPITLFKDKRKKSRSHLNTIKDGFKTLKFLLLYGAQLPLLILTFLFDISSLFFLKNFSLSVGEDSIKNFIYFLTCISITIQLFYLFSSLA